MASEIMLIGEVDDDLLKSFLDQLNASAKEEELFVYICTQGGDYYVGTAIHDLLIADPRKVTTVALGACMSAGAIMLMSGDRRLATNNTTILIHFGEESATSESDLKFSKKRLNKYKDIFRPKVKVKAQTLNKWFNHDAQFDSEEALKAGILTGIVS